MDEEDSDDPDLKEKKEPNWIEKWVDENGFVKVAEIKNDIFRYTNGYRPKWLSEFEGLIESQL